MPLKKNQHLLKWVGVDGVSDVKHKTEKGLFYILFEHSPKSVFDRKFLTIAKVNFNSQTKLAFTRDASYYQQMWGRR